MNKESVAVNGRKYYILSAQDVSWEKTDSYVSIRIEDENGRPVNFQSGNYPKTDQNVREAVIATIKYYDLLGFKWDRRKK